MYQDYEIPLSENIIITIRAKNMKKSEQYPAGVNFAVIGRVQKEENFKEVLRIDNSKHKNQIGTHAHFFDKKNEEKVQYLEDIQTPEQAYEYVENYLKEKYFQLL